MSVQSIEFKIEAGLRYKQLGNDLFKEGKYKSAISKYGTVLAYVRGLPGSKRGLDGIASMAVSGGNVNSDGVSEQQEATTM